MENRNPQVNQNGHADGPGSYRVSGGSVALPAIERLKGRENFATWSFAMRMILIREGSWAAVEGDADVPNDVKQRALATICLSLESYNYSLVQDAADAKEAWSKLKSAFQDSGLQRKIGLLRKFTSVRLVDCSTVEAYVDQLMSTSHQLASIGFQVDDSWLAAILLMGLPEQYEPMIMGLEASGVALTADAVKAKILQDVKLDRGPINSSGNVEEALYTKTKPKKSNGPRTEKKVDEKTCFNCKKPGHFAARCPSKKNPKSLCSIFTIGDVKGTEWYFDSGATRHMARADQDFVEEVTMQHDVGTANNSNMKAIAKGSVLLESSDGDVNVENVLKIPDLVTNLLSVSAICKRGNKVVFTAEKCEVIGENGEVIITGTESGGLYQVNRKEQSFLASSEIELWHKRLGHLNEGSLKKLKQVANGIDFKESSLPNCVPCLEGKQARRPFPSSASRAAELLELVHTDLCGPIEVPSLGGSRFFMTFVDDASRKVVVYFLEKKDQALEAFKKFKAQAERQTGKRFKILRSDNGGEYINAGFKKVLEQEGIRHQTTCPYTPEQNGTAERMNRTLVEKARCMLNEAKLGKQFWAEAVSTAAYLVNRCPTRSLKDQTPEEAWSGRKPTLKHLKVFGSNVMTHIPKVKRRKFDAKSEKGLFLGYCEDTKGYRVYDPVTGRFRISRDMVVISEGESIPTVVCDETKPVEFMELNFDNFQSSVADGPSKPIEGQAEVPLAVTDGTDGETDDSFRSADDSDDDLDDNALPPHQNRSADVEQGFRRSGRERHPPGKYNDYITYGTFSGDANFSQSPEVLTNNECMLNDPVSYDDVLRRPDREKWLEAMRDEMKSLDENGTWAMVDLPEGRKAIRNKWVFKSKRGPDGDIQRYKARLVVKGCSQRPGVDYDEVYSPVVRYATVRLLMAWAVKYDLDIDQMDAVTAFLQGELNDEEIFMVQPEGFSTDGGKVCRLRKALYGLKQSSRVWNAKLDGVLQEFGLRRSSVDTCLYWMMEGEKMMFVTIYVDDFLIFSNDRNLKKKLKNYLKRKFKMKDLGEAKQCLGIRITRNRKAGKLWLDQRLFTENIIERFGMADCHPVATPADPSLKLDKSMAPKNQHEADDMKKVPFKEAVGCLSFAAQVTRPDIANAVNAVSQFCSNPGRQHWEAVKRIMKYLKGTIDKRLEYSKDGSEEIAGYCDADWGGDPDSRRSTTGYVFTLQGAAISWNVKKQPTVALSSCEAEYMALSRAIQEAMWWNNLLSEIFEAQPIVIHCDNQSAISIAINGSYNPRTKHVSIRYHFVHDSLRQGVVKLNYVSTNKQPADGFTKAVAAQKQFQFCQLIGITDVPD